MSGKITAWLKQRQLDQEASTEPTKSRVTNARKEAFFIG